MRFNGNEETADERAAPSFAPTSLLTPVWRILDSLLANVQNRFDLLRTEAREAEVRFVEIFLLCSAIVVFGTIAVSLATFVLVLLAWKEGSLVAITPLIAAYAFAAAWAGNALKKRLNGPPPFSATSEELRKDQACIPHPR
jgi:uncharacterized membrane protein YqjE